MSAWLSQLFGRPARAAPDLDEAHAALDQPAGEQTTAAEIFGDRFVQAVEFAGGVGLACEIESLGRGELHSRGQFVGGDARIRAANRPAILGEMLAVHLCAADPAPSRSALGVMNFARSAGANRSAIGSGALALMIVPWCVTGRKPEEKFPFWL